MQDISEHEKSDNVANESERVIEFIAFENVEHTLTECCPESNSEGRCPERKKRNKHIGDEEGFLIDINGDLWNAFQRHQATSKKDCRDRRDDDEPSDGEAGRYLLSSRPCGVF